MGGDGGGGGGDAGGGDFGFGGDTGGGIDTDFGFDGLGSYGGEFGGGGFGFGGGNGGGGPTDLGETGFDMPDLSKPSPSDISKAKTAADIATTGFSESLGPDLSQPSKADIDAAANLAQTQMGLDPYGYGFDVSKAGKGFVAGAAISPIVGIVTGLLSGITGTRSLGDIAYDGTTTGVEGLGGGDGDGVEDIKTSKPVVPEKEEEKKPAVPPVIIEESVEIAESLEERLRREARERMGWFSTMRSKLTSPNVYKSGLY